MIIFQYPKILPSDIEVEKTHYIYIKILVCLLLKVAMLLLNIFTVNSHFNNQIYFYLYLGLLAVIEGGLVLAYKLGYFRPSSNFMSDTTSDDENNSDELEHNRDTGKFTWIPTIAWHFVFVINLMLVIFSIPSLYEAVLCTSIFKMRGPLYFIQAQCILCIAYFVTNPYFFPSTQSCIAPHLIALKKYEQSEIGFLKYLFISYIIGTFYDYISFGVQDAGLSSSSYNLTINYVTFYLSWIIFAVLCVAFLVNKYQLVERVKDLAQSQ